MNPNLDATAGRFSTIPGFSAYTVKLEDGDSGTEQTVALIIQAVQDGVSDPYIRAQALAIARRQPTNDVDAQARAIYEWVRENIRFITDGVGVETVQDPRYTLATGAGDCDCISTLLCALLGSIGIPTRLVTVATDRDDPNFSHIYPEYWAGDGERWIAIDVARSGARFGRVAEKGTYHRMRVWWLDPPCYQDVNISSEATYPETERKTISGLNGLGDWPDVFTDPDSDYFDPGAGIGEKIGSPWSITQANAGVPDIRGSEWTPTEIIKAITAGGNAASNVIRAFNQYGFPTSLSQQGYRMVSGQLVGPSGQVISGSLGIAGLSSSTIVWGALGIGVVAVVGAVVSRR